MKRMTAVLLALCLLIGVIPMAGAAGSGIQGGTSDHYTTYTKTLYVGEYFSEYYGGSSTEAYALTGTLPNGLTWEYTDRNQDSAKISGTPTKTGKFTYTISYEIESSYSLDVYHDTYIVTVAERHVDDRSSETIYATRGQALNRMLEIDRHGGALTDVKLTQNRLPSGISWQRVDGGVRLLDSPAASGYYAPSVFYSSREDGTFNSHTVDIFVTEKPEQTGDTLVVWAKESGRHYLHMDSHGTEPLMVELVEGELPTRMTWSWGAGGAHVDGAVTKPGTYTVKFLLIRYDYTAELQTLSIRVLPADCGSDSRNCPGSVFTDMPKPGNWAHAGIDYVLASGLMSGTSKTTFAPKTAMSRSMLVTVLYRMAGQPGAGTTRFSDVPAGQWYSDAVSWAADNGIVSGVGGGRFSPNANVSREQIAAILYRYAGYRDYSTSNKADLSGFADASRIGTWFVDGMKWAVAEGLISGSDMNGKTYLTPQGDATREQVAAILMRFCQNVAD